MNFWCSIYVEVRKDLKGCYLKYYWLDDLLVVEVIVWVKLCK